MKWFTRRSALVAGLVLAMAAPLTTGAPVRATEQSDMALPELTNSGIPKSEAQVMASIMADAAQGIRDVVINPQGRTEGARQFRRAFGAQKLLQIDAILQRLNVRTADWLSVKTDPRTGKLIEAPVWRAVKEGVRTAITQAEEAGVRIQGSAAQGSFSKIDEGTIRVFSRDIAARLSTVGEEAGQRAKTILRQTQQLDLSEGDIDQILAKGVIEGKPRQTTKRLQEALEAVNGGTVLVNGREYDAGKYASTVVRTKTREATVLSRHNRLEDLGVDLVSILGRVSDNYCSAFLGQIFSLSGKHPKYPAYSELPSPCPFHPNCSKSTRPFVEELANPDQLARGELLEDSRKLLNMKPAEAQRSYKDLQLRQQIAERYKYRAA